MSQLSYRLLADLVLILHLLVVVFVVAGLVLIVIGGVRGWRWIRHRGFRIIHLAAILMVIAQAWLGAACPLTTLEMWLRGRAGEAVYGGGFIAHWVGTILYYQAPPWLFTLIYTLFGALVAISWHYLPPRRR